jgi:ubiquinone/menaquinone biosynthesis C-methylase UbiE
MPESISFDRAAAFYDETRKLALPIASAVTEAILRELKAIGAEHLLEIGVGTGRIARPLMARGVSVTGIDISSLMMDRLLAQLTEEHRLPDLLLADATMLPFADASFPAALGVHVLHLVSSPAEAVEELRRVLVPGGIFLHQTHRDAEVLVPSGQWWDRALKQRGLRMPTRSTFADAEAILTRSGAQVNRLEVASEVIEVDPERLLHDTREKIHSWTWRVPAGVFEECWPEYETWFRGQFGDGLVKDEVTYLLDVWRWRT